MASNGPWIKPGGIVDGAVDRRELDAGLLDVLPRDPQHAFRRIEQGDVVPLFGERDRDDPGSTARVEDTSGRWREGLGEPFQHELTSDPAARRA